MCLYKRFDRAQLLFTQAVILRLSSHRLKPEFSLTARTLHVYMHSRLFTGDKVKSKAPVSKYGRAHGQILRWALTGHLTNKAQRRPQAVRCSEQLGIRRSRSNSGYENGAFWRRLHLGKRQSEVTASTKPRAVRSKENLMAPCGFVVAENSVLRDLHIWRLTHKCRLYSVPDCRQVPA